MPPTIAGQVFWLLVLAMPIACIARTVIYEEIFREPREYCQHKSRTCQALLARKFFYLFTCEYCFSHWVTLFFLILTGYRLLLPDWRGFLIAFFSLVLVANVYLNIYSRIRLEITQTKVETKKLEKEVEQVTLAGDGSKAA